MAAKQKVTLEFVFPNKVAGKITIEYNADDLVTMMYLITGSGCKLITHYMGGKKDG